MLLAVGWIPMTLIAVSLLGSYRSMAVSSRSTEIQNQCRILANQLLNYHYLEDPSSELINGELTQLASMYDGRILIIDKDFRAIQDTYDLIEGKYVASEEVIRCFQGQTSNKVTAQGFIEIAIPVKESEAETAQGVLLASISTDSIRDGAETLKGNASVFFLAYGVLVTALAVLLSWLLVRPVERIRQGLHEISSGHSTEDLAVKNYTETAQISEEFNKIVTQMRLLDESRQEFVSNVSHELKTPLTSISGYAEIMKNGLVRPEDMKGFAERIYNEASRLITLVEDIIKLSKLDEGEIEMEKEDVDLYDLTRRIVSRLAPQAEKRAVHVEVTGENVICHGVRQILDEMIYNICENAIKYNRRGGSVSVWVGATLKGKKIIVTDTGIGIPEDQQERIFERFYRVDKSHSKETGGTGLGLSIVKHGAMLHNAQIHVESKVGKGTKMELTF